ncbi:hypothetical protein N792_07935 [Lysobacter concretionis Ko07 = DSM 16239]|uniref:Uncharacterized protein n=1 Tax=Lysobacter concretionis Ko07 = DSM 16239 TaxID=1122185 RepID=A0A0A0EKR9_9GAMM|nr:MULTISPECIES: hypothetical protein [Lysobacter]KGM51611.1 hypothetical protein N792_07935 [Lysobacter concretionis Ko07 = DSM 16239]
MVRYPFMLGVMGGSGRIDLHATNRIGNGGSLSGVNVIPEVVGVRVVMMGVHASSVTMAMA